MNIHSVNHPSQDKSADCYSLFLRDIGLDFETVRYPYDDTWPATKEKLRKDGLSPTGLLPIIEYKGTKLSQVGSDDTYTMYVFQDCANHLQHIPILRYLSREHGGYDGDTSYEKYIVDRVADLYNDWRVSPPSHLNLEVDLC